MSNLRLILTLMALGALICGLVGAVAGTGTSILFPGLGLVVLGSIAGGLIGMFFGSILGLLIAAIIIVVRRRSLP
jgi:hypothetical protein